MHAIDYFKALWQWTYMLVVLTFAIVATFFAALPVAFTAKKQTYHPQGKPLEEEHSDKYKRRGSSGHWEYYNSNIKWLKWFNNYEDGLLREPSGKGSSIVKGKERSVLNMVFWIFRNPFNYGKRTLSLFHCMVNECNVVYQGRVGLNDKKPDGNGWAFTKATHRETKKNYYSFRWVKHVGGSVMHFYIGFKVKPEHQLTVQESDDLDKAFTIRLPFPQNPR